MTGGNRAGRRLAGEAAASKRAPTRSAWSATGCRRATLVAAGELQRGRRRCAATSRDQALLERILGEYEIDTVIHLAAQTIVGIANRNPVSTFEIEHRAAPGRCSKPAAAARRCSQIVVASSDKAYGDQRTLPYDETTPLQGAHPYDVSKSCADLIAQTYAKTYGLPVAITRCGNFYGGGDLNWNRIVPGTIRSILRGERPVIRSDGQYIRDYFYVEDGAAAYMLLAESAGRATRACAARRSTSRTRCGSRARPGRAVSRV